MAGCYNKFIYIEAVWVLLYNGKMAMMLVIFKI